MGAEVQLSQVRVPPVDLLLSQPTFLSTHCQIKSQKNPLKIFFKKLLDTLDTHYLPLVFSPFVGNDSLCYPQTKWTWIPKAVEMGLWPFPDWEDVNDCVSHLILCFLDQDTMFYWLSFCFLIDWKHPLVFFFFFLRLSLSDSNICLAIWTLRHDKIDSNQKQKIKKAKGKKKVFVFFFLFE